jgi:hypothetical protein
MAKAIGHEVDLLMEYVCRLYKLFDRLLEPRVSLEQIITQTQRRSVHSHCLRKVKLCSVGKWILMVSMTMGGVVFGLGGNIVQW